MCTFQSPAIFVVLHWVSLFQHQILLCCYIILVTVSIGSMYTGALSNVLVSIKSCHREMCFVISDDNLEVHTNAFLSASSNCKSIHIWYTWHYSQMIIQSNMGFMNMQDSQPDNKLHRSLLTRWSTKEKKNKHVPVKQSILDAIEHLLAR